MSWQEIMEWVSVDQTSKGWQHCCAVMVSSEGIAEATHEDGVAFSLCRSGAGATWLLVKHHTRCSCSTRPLYASNRQKWGSVNCRHVSKAENFPISRLTFFYGSPTSKH